ncbi:MAG: hypothetical protein ACOCRN_04455 [Spirochaetia bacterium]
MRRPYHLIVFALLTCIALPEAGALSLDVRGGLVWIGNGYRKEYLDRYIEGSDVSPLLTFSGLGLQVPLGLALPFWDGELAFVPGLDFWYKDYAFTGDEDFPDESEGRAVPTQIGTGRQEGRDVAGTLGILVSLPLDAEFPVTEELTLSGGLSPSVLLRAPVNPIEESDTEELVNYFYSDLRYLYPELRFGGLWEMSERISIHGQLRGFTPVARFYDTEESLPWWDTVMISGQTGVRISF